MNHFQKILEELVKQKALDHSSKHAGGRIPKDGVKRWKALEHRRTLRKLNK